MNTPANVASITIAADLDTALLTIYDGLKALVARPDIEPSIAASLVQSLANLSLALQDRGLAYEMLYDLDV